jgi:hypothetical protein
MKKGNVDYESNWEVFKEIHSGNRNYDDIIEKVENRLRVFDHLYILDITKEMLDQRLKYENVVE